ncbi:MAG: alkaline phosphatase family protein, partial [Gemmatimonas sp.]
MAVIDPSHSSTRRGHSAVPNTQVLLIGLDSADRGLVDRWCDAGHLPAIAALRDRGVWANLSTPEAVGDDAVWASFATGVPPGRHGRFFWNTVDRGRYDWVMSRDRPPPVPPFWVALSDAGRRVAVIDVPKCPLTPNLHGRQLVDWLTHGRDYAKTQSDPPEWAEEVLRQFGGDATDVPTGEFLCAGTPLPEEKRPVFRHHMLDGIERKSRLATEVLAEGGWDLFLVVFKESHCAGHKFLGDDGAATPDLLEVYRAMDRAVGRLVEAAGEGCLSLVFSDLGMSTNETGEHFLDQALARLEPGMITWRQRLRRRLRWNATKDKRAGRLAFQWEHNEMSGAIRFNLHGREPSGLVRPGAEHEELRRRLTRELLALRDPDSGRPVVRAVIDTATAFPGEETGRLPDLLAEWERSGPLVGATSPALGVLRVGPHPYRPGNHVSGGFCIAAGPGIAARTERPDASLLDIAPTVARLLAVDLPGRNGRTIDAFVGIEEARPTVAQSP